MEAICRRVDRADIARYRALPEPPGVDRDPAAGQVSENPGVGSDAYPRGNGLRRRGEIVRVGMGAQGKPDRAGIAFNAAFMRRRCSGFGRRHDFRSAQARFDRQYLAAFEGDDAVPVVIAAATAPAEFEDEYRFEHRRVVGDRRGTQCRRDAAEQRSVPDNVDIVDEAACDRLDLQFGVCGRLDDIALHCAADRQEQMRVIAGQRVCMPREQALPQRIGGVLAGIDGRPAVAVGARKPAVMIGVAEHAEHVAVIEAGMDRVAAVAGTHRVQERPVGQRGLGAAMHGDHLEHGRQLLLDARPVDAPRAGPVADMVREGEGAVAVASAQPLQKRVRIVGLEDLALVEVAQHDGVVAMRAGMDLVAGKHGEGSGPVIGGQAVEMPRPGLLEPGEALDVEVDDMGDARVVDRHVGPVGVPGDGDEVELAAGVVERRLQVAVAVGEIAVIVQVAIEGAQAGGGGQRHQSFGQVLCRHVLVLPPVSRARWRSRHSLGFREDRSMRGNRPARRCRRGSG